MDSITITGLSIYPVKSCRGIEIQTAELTETGFKHDREWMLIDENGRFLSQRQHPRMALIRTALSETHLTLSAPGQSDLHIAINDPNTLHERLTVQVWNDRCIGIDAGETVARWFSKFLDRKVRLVRFDASTKRASDAQYTQEIQAYNAFSDGFPLLLASQTSLDDLNRKLDAPLPMNRFRPNIVIDGIDPFSEDYIAQLSAPGLHLKPVKPCTRCEITTTNQETGHLETEPLQTLSTYRHHQQLQAIVFGQNIVIVEGIGKTLRIGDQLTVEWNF